MDMCLERVCKEAWLRRQARSETFFVCKGTGSSRVGVLGNDCSTIERPLGRAMLFSGFRLVDASVSSSLVRVLSERCGTIKWPLGCAVPLSRLCSVDGNVSGDA